MCISAIREKQNNRCFRNIAWLSAAAALCVLVSNVYALFGHGVRSAAMDFMFLYPLSGAAALCLSFLLWKRRPKRLGQNLLNSGIATLTAGGMFQGILEIAGGSSAYVKVFYIVGWIFSAAGFILAHCRRKRRDWLYGD